jgi:hypothetical protein
MGRLGSLHLRWLDSGEHGGFNGAEGFFEGGYRDYIACG